MTAGLLVAVAVAGRGYALWNDSEGEAENRRSSP